MTTCSTCHHHEPDGTCTRLPPAYAGRDEGEPIYAQPVTPGTWHCGEWWPRAITPADAIRATPAPFLRFAEAWAEIFENLLQTKDIG